MSLKTWILGTTLVSAVALPLSLPLSPAFAAGEKVAVNFVSLTIPFYVFMRQEAEDEAKKLGINLIIQDAQFSAPKQGSSSGVRQYMKWVMPICRDEPQRTECHANDAR